MKWFEVAFINENTEGLNKCFGRNNDPIETVYLPYEGDELCIDTFSDILDDYLDSVCYCDGYRIESYRLVLESENTAFDDLAYNFFEAMDLNVDKPYSNFTSAEMIETGALYYINSTWYTLKKYFTKGV